MYGKERTPLYDAFFSEFNMNVIQDGIIQRTRDQTGKTINKQDARPLSIIMESVYSVNSYNPYGDIQSQISFMNDVVIKECVKQTVMGVQSYQRYINDINSQPMPMQNPQYTSPVGIKMPFNTKLGI